MPNIEKRKQMLPDNIEDLHKYILVERAKYKAFRGLVDDIDRIEVAQGVKKQKIAEGQDIGAALLWAECRLGDLIKKIPKESGKRTDKPSRAVATRLQGAGIKKDESSRAQNLSDNKPIIKQVIKEAAANDDLPTKTEVLRKIKQKQVARDISDLKTEKVKPPTGKFKCLVVDPPWPMQKIDRDVTPNQTGFDYPVMSLDEIRNMKIQDMSHDNSHIYLWTTQKFLPAAFSVLDAWEFKYIFTMVWFKNGGFQPFGLPQYNCEFVLFGRKGSLPFLETKKFFTAFKANRNEHSRKPDEFYNLVSRVSPGPRIDIFSREKRNGFKQFGNQTAKFK